MKDPVVIVAGARTPIGSFGRSLRDLSAEDLGALVVRAAVRRAGLAPEQIDEVVMGNVGGQIGAGAYMARVCALKAGLPDETTAHTVNRLCGSGLQAINTLAGQILNGDVEIGVAGGTESMSRMPYVSYETRWGARMGHRSMTDVLIDVLNDPFHRYHMGVTAENLAKRYGISREDQDEFALVSQQRFAAAQAAGKFKDEIEPVEVPSRKGPVLFTADEHNKPDTTMEDLRNLKPVFVEGGTVTAGNASGINDGAAAVVLMRASKASQLGLTPLLEIVGWAVAGVDPEIMGIGPVPAIRKVLKRTGLTLDQIDLIELNEAFAAQSIAVIRQLDLDMARVNVNGGAIAHGHPVGATGCILTLKLAHEMRRRGSQYGMVSLCIGGGQGIATVFRRAG